MESIAKESRRFVSPTLARATRRKFLANIVGVRDVGTNLDLDLRRQTLLGTTVNVRPKKMHAPKVLLKHVAYVFRNRWHVLENVIVQ